MKRILFTCAIALFGAVGFVSDVLAGSFRIGTEGFAYLGEIHPGDEQKLEGLLRRRELAYGIISLNSSGGDVSTAMKIGRLLREHHKQVFVDQRASCRSACVFVLAGAVMRTIRGKVEIHRPYFSELNASLSEAQVDRLYKKLREDVVVYFKEMNVPTTLADAMYAIPPGKSQVLTEAELARFMLNQIDPVYDEMLTANEAGAYRITSLEYRRRSAAADSMCDSILSRETRTSDDVIRMNEDYDTCRVSVLARLPTDLARERFVRWNSIFYSGRLSGDTYLCQAAVILDGAKECPPSVE